MRADDNAWRAWKLHRRGLTYRDISRIIACSLGHAHWLVERARGMIAKVAAEEIRVEVADRERAIIASHWLTRKDPDSAKVIQASDKILVDLYGASAPKRTEHTGHDGGPITFDLSKLSDEQIEKLADGNVSVFDDDDDDAPSGAGVSGEEAPNREAEEPG